jgi:hypothetical protein
MAPATSGQALSWTPWIWQFEPATPFDSNHFNLRVIGRDADTQPGAMHYRRP